MTTVYDALRADDVVGVMKFSKDFDHNIHITIEFRGNNTEYKWTGADGYLYSACKVNATKCIKALLDNGANPTTSVIQSISYNSPQYVMFVQSKFQSIKTSYRS